MSGLIPQPFIDDLLHRTDLVELIDSYVPLKKEGTVMLPAVLFITKNPPRLTSLQKNSFITALAVVLQAMPSALS